MKLKNIKNKLFPTTFLLIIFLFPLVVFGATPLEIQYPDLPGFSVSGGTNFFVYAFNFLIYVGGIVAIIAIIYQAISIAFSKGNIAKVTEAKDRIRAAFFGLAILLGSYLILMAINPDLTKIRLADVSWTNGIDWLPDTKIDPNVTYKEIPLGSIIESILIPTSTTEEQKYNYSQFYGKTEELCYLYDVEGNTLDRNNDGFINVKDTVEGLDMSVCMDNLLKAVIAKISWFNGNEAICNGNTSGTAGPINSMKASIRTGCRCSENGTDRCARWPDITFPPAPFSDPPYVNGCRTLTQTFTCTDSDGGSYEEEGTICDQHCACCGSARGNNSGCQTTPANPFYENNSSNYAVKDPCTTRPQIDCARQEMNYRIYGTGLGLGLKCAGIYNYSQDIAPFIDEDNNRLKIADRTGSDGQIYKAEFLTFQEILSFSINLKPIANSNKVDRVINFNNDGRVISFKKYFDARLDNLNTAIKEINYDKNKNVLSFAEFQNLEETSQEIVGKEFPFPNYDTVTYHNFVCDRYEDDDPEKPCIKGGPQELEDTGYAFLPGEKYNSLDTLGEGKAVIANMNVDSSSYIYDHQADGWPFTAKRLWNNKLMLGGEKTTYNSGDPATLYILSNPGTKDPNKYSAAARKGIIDNSPTGAQCTLKGGEIEKTEAQQIKKGTLISNIPIGELAEKTFKYVSDLKTAIDGTIEEIKNTIESADQLANVLPEACDCSNCKNTHDCQRPKKKGNTCAPNTYCGPQGCTICDANQQTVCDYGCTDCSVNKNIDTLWYHCLFDGGGSVGSGWAAARNFSFFENGEMNPFQDTGCDIGVSGAQNTSNILSGAPVTFTGKQCYCEDKGYYVDIDRVTCWRQLDGHESTPALVCTMDEVTKILFDGGARLVSLQAGLVCQCTTDSSGRCQKPKNFDLINHKVQYEPLNCNKSQLFGGTFTKDSDCYNLVKNLNWECTKPVVSASGVNDNFWKVSCSGDTPKLSPTHTLSSANCEGLDTEFSEEEIQQLKDLNPGLVWNDLGFDIVAECDEIFDARIDISTYNPYSLVYRYAPTLSLPDGFDALLAWDFSKNKFFIKVEKETEIVGDDATPKPKEDNQPYYVCPYNAIKQQQSLIYKKVSPTPSFLDIQGLGKNQSCTDDIPGFLQRIEVWRQRLWDFQRVENLLPTDENRFSLLDTLSVARSRFNQCVQGYNNQYKEAAAYAYLFTCEEGVTFQSLGTYLIYPKFPPYNSLLPSSAKVTIDPSTGDTYRNPQLECFPLNSPKLTENQKAACYVNKDKTGPESCQEYIKNYLNDFYCCLGSQPGSLPGTQ